jgi:hypothetical protein
MAFNDLSLSERRLIARHGTAFFAQRLAELTDEDLDGDTLLDGWTRRHLVADALNENSDGISSKTLDDADTGAPAGSHRARRRGAAWREAVRPRHRRHPPVNRMTLA